MKKILFAIFAALVCVLFAGCENKEPEEEPAYADFEYYDNYYYVEFTNISSKGLTAWSWEFGNGDSYIKEGDGTYPNTIKYTYQESGIYKVRMKVTNFHGIDLSCTKEVRVRM